MRGNRTAALVTLSMALTGCSQSINQKHIEATTELTWLVAESYACVASRYAYLMQRTLDLQPSDCFVCSAVGLPPESSIGEGYWKPFSKYQMMAYIISGTSIEKTTIPIKITIFNSETPEEITIDAKITHVTNHFYIADFEFPRKKLPTNIPALIDIKCGTGEKYEYNVLIEPKGIFTHILMNDSIYTKSENLENESLRSLYKMKRS
jgi:hypothetical protein